MSAPPILKPRIPVIVLVALTWALVVDIPTSLGLGPLSASGAATLGLAALLLMTAPLVIASRGRVRPPIGASKTREPYLPERFDQRSLPIVMTLFVVAAIGLLALRPNTDGLQNVAVYVIFIATIPITAALCSAGTAEVTLNWLRRIAILVGAVTAAQSLAGVEIYGPRSVALVLVVFTGIALALPTRNNFERLLPFLLIGACALSLSRTALFVAAVLVPVSYLFTAAQNRFAKLLAVAIPMVYLMYVLVTTWAPLRNRFLQGDAAYSAGGLDLNTSGRTVLWQMTTDSWQESPLLGKGPGSASSLISARFDRIAHPHNEYLRILHDFGLVGFVPFALGLALITVAVWQRAQRLPGPVHKAAVLSLLGVLAVAFTDNVLIYPFVMLPVGVLVGLSMAQPLPKRKQHTRIVSVVAASTVTTTRSAAGSFQRGRYPIV